MFCSGGSGSEGSGHGGSVLGRPAALQCWFERGDHRIRPGLAEAQVLHQRLWRTHLEPQQQPAGNAAHGQWGPGVREGAGHHSQLCFLFPVSGFRWAARTAQSRCSRSWSRGSSFRGTWTGRRVGETGHASWSRGPGPDVCGDTSVPPPNPGRIISLSWHPSGTLIAAGMMDMIRIFDASTGEGRF